VIRDFRERATKSPPAPARPLLAKLSPKVLRPPSSVKPDDTLCALGRARKQASRQTRDRPKANIITACQVCGRTISIVDFRALQARIRRPLQKQGLIKNRFPEYP